MIGGEQAQCQGITTKGSRCKIRVPATQSYCHYHVNQQQSGKGTISKSKPAASTSSSSPSRKTVPSPKKQPLFAFHVKPAFVQHKLQTGYIYVYTLQHLLDPKPQKQDWLQLKKKSDSNWKVFNPKQHILIKIGMTSKTVQQRLKEWENKCRHKLISVDPFALKEKTLLGMFRKLSLDPKRDLSCYDCEGNGFHTKQNLSAIEKDIHKELWERYGKGDIVCHGCKSADEGGGIHKEWFFIERKNLKCVFKIIDDIVRRYQ